ncbi:MAG: hypothetical protein NC218_07320 [Acetobacter sp.]|nr:hypothetical protein [Acetobacter sp.]
MVYYNYSKGREQDTMTAIAMLVFYGIEMFALWAGYNITPWVALIAQVPAGIVFLVALISKK